MNKREVAPFVVVFFGLVLSVFLADNKHTLDFMAIALNVLLVWVAVDAICNSIRGK